MAIDELPDGWLSCSLGDVVDYGKTAKAEPSEIEENAWILELEDIEKETSKLLERRTFAERQSKSTKNRFDVGDVLYGKLRPYLNKVIIADQAGCCTTEIIPLKSNAALNGRYLFYWLRHPAFLDYVGSVSHGLNMPRLGTEAGKAAPFVLAPFAEQKRIADKLEAVLGRVDACRARLDRVPDLLKRFHQSVLAAATSGRLTEDWRTTVDADNSQTDGMAIQQLSEKYFAPESWPTTTFAELTNLITSGSRGWADFYSPAGAVFIRAQNINSDRLVLDDVAYVSLPEKAEGKRALVQRNDLLVTITGANVGKSARVMVNLDEAYISQHVALLKLNDQKLAAFLELFLWSENAGRGQLNVAAYGGGKPGLNLQNLRELVVALPPLPEQQEIVRRVEALFAFANRIEARLTEARAQVERLTPATLAKAFRGELVPQDPKDEPASELLKRLRIERTLSVTSKPRKTQAPKRPRAPKDKAAMTKSRFDEDVKGQPYLANLLRTSSKPLNAENLFKGSELPLVDFYKQLAWEVEQGLIHDDKTKLEAA